MLAYRQPPPEDYRRSTEGALASSSYRPAPSAVPLRQFVEKAAPSASSSSSRAPAAHPLPPRLQSLPPQASAAPPSSGPAASKPTEQPPAAAKADKGKLTEQWGPPPTRIRRDQDILQRGQLLGEGGFARVYLTTEPDGVTTKALKVIAKEQLKSTKNKSKLFGEIKIHQAMQHPNIISFEHCFEDEGNVYMQLELCSNGSLLDLLRKRRRYSEPEARFYLVQLIGACEYMHSNSVIHRDLKLGNLMLDSEMNLRVGDFGLAALVKFPGERKKTICGTPNYIAPEILFDTTNGHSFEVDIWSIGVILYTLLVGKPPFQTKDVKNIYRKIKDNNYVFPAEIELSVEAVDLISNILTTSPEERPTLAEILQHDFFTTGPFPASISPSSMTSPPDYRHMSIRAAHRNFKAVKTMCGIVDSTEGTSAPAPVQQRMAAPLQAVVEEEEEDSKPKRTMVQQRASPQATVQARPASTREARGMEKEVQQVLAPESPISELLRSARKPLMVSPNAEPRDLLQRKLLHEARQNPPVNSNPPPPPFGRSSSTRQLSSTKENGSGRDRENAAPSSAKDAGRGGATAVKQSRSALGSSRQANVAAEAEGVDAVTAAMGAMKAPTSARLPARELYDSTWRTLNAALLVATTADLEALPNPTPEPPKVFITSWVDYTHKYGTAYSLTDGTAGLYFNDSTTMVLSPDKVHFDYISNRKANVYSRRHYASNDHPEDLKRKTYLLEYFEDYMAKTLTRDVAWTFVDSARKRNMDFLVKYYRMKNAIVFKMSNDVLQFNFYDHTKLLLTGSGSVLTFIDHEFRLRTYSLGALFVEASKLGYYSRSGPKSTDPRKLQRLDEIRFLVSKLEYCRDVLKNLSSRKSTSASTTASTIA